MANPQFFDINSSQFQEITPTGNEEIQVGATQKVKLSSIASLVDLTTKTLAGLSIPTPFANVSKVAATDTILSALAKLIAFTSNGFYRTIVGRIDNQNTVAIYSYDKDVSNKNFVSLIFQLTSTNLIVGTFASTGSTSSAINPETYNTDQALLEAIWNKATKKTFIANPQETPGNSIYTITSDNVATGMTVLGNMNYIIQKASGVTISTDKTITLNSANFDTGKESTLICIPTNIVSTVRKFTFIPASGNTLYGGPGFTKSGNNVYCELDNTLGSVLVIAIQYVANLGFAINCAYYA